MANIGLFLKISKYFIAKKKWRILILINTEVELYIINNK